MTNYEKITAAAKMGYACKFKDLGGDEYTIVSFRDDDDFYYADSSGKVRSEWSELFFESFDENKYEIMGYTYVGHLFGEPVVPEGQRFIVKGGNKIGDVELFNNGFISLVLPNRTKTYHLSELEPVFD